MTNTTNTAPLPAGARCTLDGRTVRAYATIWPGVAWHGAYRCIDSERRSTVATREQLAVVGL